MKPYLPLLILFISCSKVNLEEPQKPEPISFTQTRIMHDSKNAYTGTLAVIHFHRVDDPALIQAYKNLPARQAFCDDINDTLVTVLGKPDNCDLK